MQGVSVQGSGYRRTGGRQNQHHQTLRASAFLAALQGDDRGRLCSQSDQLGQQDTGPVTAVGHRR